jgi:hypothetical protein
MQPQVSTWSMDHIATCIHFRFFLQAKGIHSDQEWPDLNQQLDDLLADAQSSNNVAQLEGHEKYLELKQKIWDILHPG